MPLYEYECRNCGHRVDVLHGVNDPGPTACEQCGGAMRKLFSTPAIVFKGSGFAKKDARDARSKAKPSIEKAKTEASDGSSSSDGATKSDTGSAAKSTEGAVKPAAGKESSAPKAAD